MDQASLVNEQIVAGEQFLHAFNDYVSITAAFWISPADSDKWVLYVASSEIEAGRLRDAYREVLQLIGKAPSQWLDAFQVKLLNDVDPLAAKVIEIRDRYPAGSPTRYDGSSIAGLEIDGAYIYPPITATSSTP